MQAEPVSLSQMLSKLNPSELRSLFEVLNEYQTMLNEESRGLGGSPGDPASGIGADNGRIQQAMEQAKNGLNQIGALGAHGENIMEILLLVLKSAAEGQQEDLKNIMDHVKGINKEKEGFRKVQDKLPGTNDGKGGARFGSLTAAGGLLVLILLLMVWFVRPPATDDTPPASITVTVPVPAPQVDGAAAGGGADCHFAFTGPASGDPIPLSGPLEVEWDRVPRAGSYSMRLILPPGAGNDWLVNTDRAGKSLYMENFPAAGQYELIVTALGVDGAELCSNRLLFDKGAFDSAESGDHKNEADGGSGPACGENGMFGC